MARKKKVVVKLPKIRLPRVPPPKPLPPPKPIKIPNPIRLLKRLIPVPPPPPPPPPDPDVGRIRRYRDNYYQQRDQINNLHNQYKNIHWNTSFDWENIQNAIREEQKIANAKAEQAKREAEILKTKTFNNTVDVINKDLNNHNNKKNLYFENQRFIIYKILNDFMKKTQAQMSDLITDISNQNVQMEKQIQQNKTNDNGQKYTQYQYLKIEIDKIMGHNKILWYIYYTLVFISAIVIFYNNYLNNRTLNLLLFLLITYPYFIYYLEVFLYTIVIYLKKLYTLTPFNNFYLNL